MKTDAIKQSIISNYKILSEKSKMQSNQGNIRTVWGLNYTPNGRHIGFVSEFGLIERKGAKIDIRENKVIPRKRPFYMTWKHALQNINSMLENIITNYDNTEIVRKRYVNIFCFPEKFLNKMSKK